MQFVVTKQIAVEAKTPEEAVAKSSEGKTITVSAGLRPQPAQSVSGGQVTTRTQFQNTETKPTPGG